MMDQDEVDQHAGLEKIKRQLAPPAGSVTMQGYLLKRSETLRRWNQRWFSLDPTTAKMEYRTQRGDPVPRGLVTFEAESTITVSPINFHGAKQYDGCCFFIGVSKKREYYLCAETPGAARAWVATLRAASLVLKAHREAVNALSTSNGKPHVGAVAAAAAVANATAREAAKEVAAANQKTILGGTALLQQAADCTDKEPSMDNMAIMKETLRVKDEELHQMAADLRARDSTIHELAERVSETAGAAEAAAAAAQSLDRDRAAALAENESMKSQLEVRMGKAALHVKAAIERAAAAEQDSQKIREEAQELRERLAQVTAAYAAAEAARQEALREADHWRGEAARGMSMLASMNLAPSSDNMGRDSSPAVPLVLPPSPSHIPPSKQSLQAFEGQASLPSSLGKRDLHATDTSALPISSGESNVSKEAEKTDFTFDRALKPLDDIDDHSAMAISDNSQPEQSEHRSTDVAVADGARIKSGEMSGIGEMQTNIQSAGSNSLHVESCASVTPLSQEDTTMEGTVVNVSKPMLQGETLDHVLSSSTGGFHGVVAISSLDLEEGLPTAPGLVTADLKNSLLPESGTEDLHPTVGVNDKNDVTVPGGHLLGFDPAVTSSDDRNHQQFPIDSLQVPAPGATAEFFSSSADSLL